MIEMAKAESELRQIVSNMEKMGWKVRPTQDGNGYLVGPPGMSGVVTINVRAAGHGRGLDNVEREIRRTNYYTLWEEWQNRQAEIRASRPVPRAPLNGTPQPVLAVDKDDVALKPPLIDAPKVTPKPSKIYIGSLAMLDGQDIVDRAKAKMVGPNPSHTEPTEVDGIDEVMLADGRLLYQCVRSSRCYQGFDTVRAAAAHLRKHGTRQRAAREDARSAKAARAGRTAQDVRRSRRALLVGDESRAEWLNTFADTLEQAAPILRELARLQAPECPEPQEKITDGELAELRAKAKKWDQFREMTRD